MRETPVSIPIDFTEVMAALGVSARCDPGRVAAVLQGEPEQALACQFDPDEGFDPLRRASGTLSVVLPPGRGEEHVRVYFTAEAPRIRPPAGRGLEVEVQDGRVVVRNDYYEVVHDVSRMAGLPSRIVFRHTGKLFDGFAINDRVHDTELGSFWLRNDTEAGLEVDSRGPVRAAVRLGLRYVGQNGAPAANPQATYEFSYYAGSPVVMVKAEMRQAEPFPWKELHLLEVNFPDESFTRWAADDPDAAADLVAEGNTHTGGSWGAVLDGPNVLGLLGCGPVRIHDGRAAYGTYVHGPWVGWEGTQRELSAWMYLSGAPGAIRAIDELADAPGLGVDAVVTVQPLLRALNRLQTAIKALPRGAQRGRYAWAASLAERLAHGQGRLRDGLHAIDDLLAHLDGSAGRTRRDPLRQIESRLREGGEIALVDNGEIGIGVAAAAGKGVRLTSLFDFAAERELLPLNSEVPLFSTELGDADGNRAVIDAASGWGRQRIGRQRIGGARPGLEIEWSEPEDKRLAGLSAHCQVGLRGKQSAWRLRIDNPSADWGIRRVRFPQVVVGRLGESAADDYLVTPNASGRLLRAPLLRPPDFRGTYPSGRVTMQFMCHYDADGGLYVGFHDPLASTKEIHCRAASGRSALDLAFDWPNADMGVAGSDFEHPGEAVLAAFGGDWFDAARIYKRWASRKAKWWPRANAGGRPDTPRWMAEIAIWGLMSGEPKNVVGPMKDFARYMGVPTAVHWYSWHQIPFDNDYPHYFPTKQGFAAAVRELQAAGVRVMPYINGRLWDSDLDDFENMAIRYAAKNEKGDHYVEVYGSGEKLVPMCPATRLWQEKVQEIVLRLVGPECGVDGVYIDQIAAAAPRLCFDSSHGHPLGGGHWWTADGYWPMLSSLQRRLPPGKMITSECNAESYCRWVDGFLTWHFQNQGQIPLFAAVYGGNVQLFSRAYRGKDKLAYRMKAAQSLVFGEQIGWINANIIQDEVNGPFFRRMARLRYALLRYLSWGEMARPPALEGDIPEVTADWAWRDEWLVTDSAIQRGAWRARDGRVALIFVNVTDGPLSAMLRFDGTDYGFPAARRVTVQARAEDGTAPPSVHDAKFTMPIELPAFGALALEIARAGGR